MEYVLNDNLSKEELINLGFTNHNKPFLYYYKTLYIKDFFDIVSLSITINLDTSEFNIEVLDEVRLQPYLPFYNERELDSHIHTKDVLNTINENFDKEMNILIEKGVFKNKNKVK